MVEYGVIRDALPMTRSGHCVGSDFVVHNTYVHDASSQPLFMSVMCQQHRRLYGFISRFANAVPVEAVFLSTCSVCGFLPLLTDLCGPQELGNRPDPLSGQPM